MRPTEGKDCLALLCAARCKVEEGKRVSLNNRNLLLHMWWKEFQWKWKHGTKRRRFFTLKFSVSSSLFPAWPEDTCSRGSIAYMAGAWVMWWYTSTNGTPLFLLPKSRYIRAVAPYTLRASLGSPGLRWPTLREIRSLWWLCRKKWVARVHYLALGDATFTMSLLGWSGSDNRCHDVKILTSQGIIQFFKGMGWKNALIKSYWRQEEGPPQPPLSATCHLPPAASVTRLRPAPHSLTSLPSTEQQRLS